MFKAVEATLDEIKSGKIDKSVDDLEYLANHLSYLVKHYKVVLGEHNIALPFNDRP